ncbi:hypothetical protein COX03_02850 [Candidatus Woesebacteria bacterium CG22_combo_CG10-13_8_21_14_all_39_10]|uniref:Uncharacterized protein n=2 Tax=Candidatus Woeseibacteriota TaxID=1752722 RepID=A0A2H0BIG3_9BACT|nr:MAG: hypothetical protein COX03_02850 [Candidatus Woesebacteria bacterium CG22_combo_CG10-13_8_21_14_all_39_10]PIZ48599.1 MAG: hypothetical protein COY29_03380 [Candidatus Woesebacteria bacterium CG_4_10_14_0_2_um_filter_39_14]
MPIFPEREKNIIETPEEASPLTIERKEVVTPIPITFQKQVKTDSGKPLIEVPGQGGRIKITIPKPQTELESLSKGSISDSITWFAAFWIRMIKKAIYYGYRIFIKS